MEQNKINAILIAGIIVVGAGAWAGPVMTAQTANQFLVDLSEIQTAQIGFYEGEGFNFDEFGLGTIKDEIFFFDHDDTFALDVAFVGPIIELIAFAQELVPADNAGIVIPTAADGIFGQPHTLIEMQACGVADADLDGTGARLFDECQPAIVDKIFVMATVGNVNDNEVFRLQVAVCEDVNAVNTKDSDIVPDSNAANDECNASNIAGDDFLDAIIILDLILQPYIDHTETIIIDAGAIPAFQGSALMVRAADSSAQTNTLTVWVGVERVGSEGGFEFLNPAQFGVDFVDGCVLFDIESNGVDLDTGDAGIFMDVFGIPFFAETDGVGRVQFENVPLGSFAIIDLELANLVLFLDQVIGTSTNNLDFGSGCFEIEFDIVTDKPQF